MNEKITAISPSGKKIFCIVSADAPTERELERVFGIDGHHGVGIYIENDEILYRDYFHWEVMGRYPIVSREKTEQSTAYRWEDA